MSDPNEEPDESAVTPIEPIPEPEPAPVPDPIPEVDPIPVQKIVKPVAEEPEHQVPDVVIINDPNALVATEAEIKQGLVPKGTPEAPKASDFPQYEPPVPAE